MIFLLCVVAVYSWYILDVHAQNISTYSDTISNSVPSVYSNHTMQFTLGVDIAAGGYIDLIPPSGFTILSTSTFVARNIELYVNGTPRVSSSTGDATTDEVAITPGSPGSIRYTFNSTTGVSDTDILSLRIGSHTSGAYNGEVIFSTSTGTTTLPQDIGIVNSSSTGSYRFALSVFDGSLKAARDFLIAIVDSVGLGPSDTTEDIPPFRFNGAPTGDVGGTTLSVELSVETDEFAICKFSTTASTSFAAMVDTFESTGLVVHTEIIPGLTNNTSYVYYVRCIDDEDNFNIDDYVISFNILEVPDGTPNTEGGNEGDGTGSSDDGTGTSGSGEGGTGSGGTSGSGGSSSGSGGSGGGSGGSSGDDNVDESGGGFESADRPYRSGDGTVIINGYAFPRSIVTVLVDGQIAETSNADSKGKFSVTLDDIARGVYTFGIYATDDNDVKSTTFSTSFSVQGARTSSLSNINIMPSILVVPDPVDLGAVAKVTGFSIPDATISIENENDKSTASLKTFTTTSDSSGEWSIDVDTTGFTRGTYKIRAKAEQIGGVETHFSDYTYYGVGQEAEVQISADLNRDGSVNLVDFSILLFWWGSDGGISDPPADINRDGNVSLTDFSIMLFNWTG
ncbi:hypothetical protein N8083_02125 [Candidatus Pacebacteria bacterium]|nr:hypothetical protein [Candidatus Paceibacterota bacterium]